MLDTVFKAILTGDSEDSRIALRFVLSGCIHRQVRDVRVLNNELIPEHQAGKAVRLDLHLTFNDGEQAGLEMQMGPSADDLKARASLYGARLLSGQAKRGAAYGSIRRVYQIFFLNCVLFPGSDKLPRRYSLMEQTEHDKLNELQEIIFYELPKLEKQVSLYFEDKLDVENLRNEEKWCIYLKYRQDERMAGVIAELCRQEEGIMHAERALTRESRDMEKWARALFREKAEMDYRGEMYSSREQGKAEGLALGKAAGYKQAREESYREKLEIARKMKARGVPVEEIVDITGLPPEVVD
jgi:predicted transposase/invertase (TIGR01784 family)